MKRRKLKLTCGNGAICTSLFLFAFVALAINLPIFQGSNEAAFASPPDQLLYDTPDQGYNGSVDLSDKNSQKNGDSSDYYGGGEFDTGYKNDPTGEVEHLIEQLDDLDGFDLDI